MKIIPSFAAILVLSVSINVASGQSLQDRKEKIEAQKVTYITKQVNLTPEEAQLFWPLYNEFQQKKQEIQQLKRGYMRQYLQQSGNLGSSELEELVDAYVDSDVQIANLQQEYHNKYKTILSTEKIIALYKAETQFKQFLLKQIKEQGTGNRQRPDQRF